MLLLTAVPIPEMASPGIIQARPVPAMGSSVHTAVLRTRTAAGALVVGLAGAVETRGVSRTAF